MSIVKNHIIHRASIDLSLIGKDYPNFQDHILKNWCVKNLLELVEESLDEQALADSNILIDKLELKVDLQLNDFKQTLSPAQLAMIKEKFVQQLEAAKQGADIKSSTVLNEEIVLRYLELGYFTEALSGEALRDTLNKYKQEVFAEKQRIIALLKVLQPETAFVRFLQLFGLEFFHQLLGFISNRSQSDWNIWIKETGKILVENKQTVEAKSQNFLHVLAIAANTYHEPVEMLANAYKHFSFSKKIMNAGLTNRDPTIQSAFQKLAETEKEQPNNTADPATHTTSKKRTNEPLQNLAIENAGLVLLAPFLPELLRNLNYLDDNAQPKTPSSLPILFHFLCTGKSEAEEWELVLPKILSGLALADNCETSLVINEIQLKEIGDLLKTVISHWAALKNTSTEGLRQSFLQRQGSISEEGHGWKLKIIEEVPDILLQFVPWNFRMIKLPWMQKLLVVEWG